MAKLLHALSPGWYRLARRWHSHELATELTQDIATRVHRGLPSFRFDSAFTTWTYRIALNVINDARRKQRRGMRTVPIDAVPAKHLPATSDDPLTRLALQRAIATLEPELAEVITLRYDGGLRFAEIAEVLNLPLGTVSTRLRRALAKLAHELDTGDAAHETRG